MFLSHKNSYPTTPNPGDTQLDTPMPCHSDHILLSGRGWVDAALGKLETLAIRTDAVGCCAKSGFGRLNMLTALNGTHKMEGSKLMLK